MTETALAILASVLGGVNIIELLAFFLFFKQNKKSKELDNDGKQNDNFDKLLESTNKVIDILEDKFRDSEEDSNNKREEIKKLQVANEELLKGKFDLMTENMDLKIRLQKAELLKCEVKGCKLRQPPTGY